ncbi:hypothetical protein RP20_CCG024461 [Aedes albopictus]|nr:hypothetical protein RP20_CCG024461 [Aedes albopictus]
MHQQKPPHRHGRRFDPEPEVSTRRMYQQKPPRRYERSDDPKPEASTSRMHQQKPPSRFERSDDPEPEANTSRKYQQKPPHRLEKIDVLETEASTSRKYQQNPPSRHERRDDPQPEASTSRMYQQKPPHRLERSDDPEPEASTSKKHQQKPPGRHVRRDDPQPEASTSRKHQQKPQGRQNKGDTDEDLLRRILLKFDDDENQSLSDTGSKSGGKRVQQRKKGGNTDLGYDRRRINKKLRLLRGPLLDIPPIKVVVSKFSANNQLYIGNLAEDVVGEELAEMFSPYGEVGEVVVNKDNPKNIYALLRMDYFSNAVHAKRVMQGLLLRYRPMCVRFAPYASTIRVYNLTQWVSNELLHKAFEVFGPVERALVYVDERGKPTNEGMVEFKNETGAKVALRYCTKKCFFLSASLRPVIVELHTQQHDPEGLPEKTINKDAPEFQKERQKGPHFADPDSFEHQYGQRWKQMHELYKEKAEAVKRELAVEEQKLEAQMEFARFEHDTEQIRKQLRQREQGRGQQHQFDLEMKERMAAAMSEIEQMQNRIKRTYETLHRYSQERMLCLQDKEEDNEGDSRLPSEAVKQEDTGGLDSSSFLEMGNEKDILRPVEAEKQAGSGGGSANLSGYGFGKTDREKGTESDNRPPFQAVKQEGSQASFTSARLGETDRQKGNESVDRRSFGAEKRGGRRGRGGGKASRGSYSFGERDRTKGNESDKRRSFEVVKPGGSGSGQTSLGGDSFGEKVRNC